MTVNEILTAIEQEKNQKEKMRLIAQHANDELLKLVVQTALDPNLNFYTKVINHTEVPINIFSVPEQTTLHDFIGALLSISMGKSCNKAQQNRLDIIYTQLSEGDQVVAKQIIARKLRCGAGLSKWREAAWGDSFIPEWGCMLASQFNLEKIQKYIFMGREKHHAFSERKTDGQRCEYLGWENKMYTRKGKEYHGLTTVREQLCDYLTYLVIPDHPCFVNTNYTDFMIDGELVVLDEYGDIMPRSEGNGLINKFVRGKGDLSIEPNIAFIVWDIVPRAEFELRANESDKIEYHERRMLLRDTYNEWYKYTRHEPRIELQYSIVVNNITEAIKHYQNEVNQEQEGTLLKAWHALWDACPNSNRPNSQFKFKEKFDCEFVITGCYDGEKGSKYEGLIGGFYIESADGKVKCKCGGGMSDAIRNSDRDSWTGKIITVAFNALSKKKGSDVFALQHPRLIEERIDKTDADTLDRILEHIESTRALALEQVKLLGK